eukprot:2154727-Pleurochrysis_carterae.AAC.1
MRSSGKLQPFLERSASAVASELAGLKPVQRDVLPARHRARFAPSVSHANFGEVWKYLVKCVNTFPK